MTEFANVGSPTDNEPSSIVELTWREAEQRFGRRVDRRMRYAVDGTELLVLCRYTTACSGCTDDDLPGHIGEGCDECGYTGKRRHAVWQSEQVWAASRG